MPPSPALIKSQGASVTTAKMMAAALTTVVNSPHAAEITFSSVDAQQPAVVDGMLLSAATGVTATMPPTIDASAPPAGASTPPTSPTSTAIGVPAAPNKELCRSIRNAELADVHTLHKAEWLTAKKNLKFPGNSFISFPNSKVFSNLGRIGINLGPSDVLKIKNMEVDRLVLSANQKKNISKSKFSRLHINDENYDRLEAVLSHACADQSENLLDTENDQIIDLSPLHRKKKYNSTKNIGKGKLPKKPKPPSKIILK